MSQSTIAPSIGLYERNLQPELMDQPGLPSDEHDLALRGLARINRLSSTAGKLWRPIAACLRSNPQREWRLLDIACGGGDVPLQLARRARRAGYRLHVAGCDMSETALEIARAKATRQNVAAEFFVREVLTGGLPEGYDIITSTLFLHHLETADAVKLLKALGRTAGTLAVLSDLRRSRTGYALAVAACHLLSRSNVVHHDGPASVRAAFSLAEARRLLKAAGFDKRATVRRSWPQRFLMTIPKQ